jgi:hypothetical protein
VELARHETEGHFEGKVSVPVISGPQKGLESSFPQNIFKQELAHDFVLDTEGNTVEIGFLFPEDGRAIILPEVSEVRFYLAFQDRADVFAVVLRLVPHVFY